MADDALGDLPELVRDSRLPATFQSDHDHHYTIHDRAGAFRRKQTEIWVDIENLGSGGQGSVDLQANNESGKRQFRAVKTIRFRQGRLNENPKLYTRELEAIFKFSQARYSPLFVRSSGWFSSKSHLHIAMEYCERGDLYHYLQNPDKCPSNRLSEDEVCDIAVQVLYALQEMHGENFAHRDIKPANILIEDHPPNPWRVKVGDFGLSKRNGDADSTTVRGTPSFMPPELLGYHADPRAADPYPVDMWCLGETLFRALAGRAIFLNTAEIGKYYNGQKEFPFQFLQELQAGEKAVNFLQSLVLPIPEKRLTVRDALTHPWIRTETMTSASGQLIASIKGSWVTDENSLRDAMSGEQLSKASASWTNTVSFNNESILVAGDAQKHGNKYHTDSSNKGKEETTSGSHDSNLDMEIPIISFGDLDLTIGGHSLDLTDISSSTDGFGNLEAQDHTNPPEESLDGDQEMEGVAGRLFNDRNFPQAERVYRQISNRRTKALGPYHPKTLRSMQGLADTLYAQDELEGAELIYRETANTRRRVLGEGDHETLQSMQTLATTLHKLKLYDDSERVHRRTIELLTRTLGEQHQDTLSCRQELAHLLYNQGKFIEAMQTYEVVLEISEKALGRKNGLTLSRMERYAVVLMEQGRYLHATRIYKQLIILQGEVFGPDHENSIQSKQGLRTAVVGLRSLREREPHLAKEIDQLMTDAVGFGKDTIGDPVLSDQQEPWSEFPGTSTKDQHTETHRPVSTFTQRPSQTRKAPTTEIKIPSRMLILGRRVRKMINGHSDAEMAMREAINSDVSELEANNLHEIARMTYGEYGCSKVTRAILKRLHDEKKDSNCTVKILKVLEYCLYHGSDRIMVWAFSNRFLIQRMQFLFHIDGEGRDVHQEVRAAAKSVSDLIVERNSAALTPEPISLLIED